MDIRKFSKTGSYHSALHQENQDFVYGMESRDTITMMLADGATACEMGLEGAKLSCQAMAQVVEREGAGFFHYPKGKIAYLITEQILYYIERNKAEPYEMRDYGSTFALVFLEKKTGRTVLVNLGDGAILSVDAAGQCAYRMRPKRYRGNPCLTTTKDARKAIEVEVQTTPFGSTLILCSDGFLEMLKNGEVAERLNRNDPDGLEAVLLSSETSDDCSYISFTRKRN